MKFSPLARAGSPSYKHCHRALDGTTAPIRFFVPMHAIQPWELLRYRNIRKWITSRSYTVTSQLYTPGWLYETVMSHIWDVKGTPHLDTLFETFTNPFYKKQACNFCPFDYRSLDIGFSKWQTNEVNSHWEVQLS